MPGTADFPRTSTTSISPAWPQNHGELMSSWVNAALITNSFKW
jgi:hypothetical protein